jgi:hypothetical protein
MRGVRIIDRQQCAIGTETEPPRTRTAGTRTSAPPPPAAAAAPQVSTSFGSQCSHIRRSAANQKRHLLLLQTVQRSYTNFGQIPRNSAPSVSYRFEKSRFSRIPIHKTSSLTGKANCFTSLCSNDVHLIFLVCMQCCRGRRGGPI